MAAALHAQIWFQRSDQSQSSTPGQPPNGSPVLKYFLSQTIHAQENGSRGTHFAKFLISNFLKGLAYSAMMRTNVCCLVYVIKDAVTSFYYWDTVLTLQDSSVSLLVTAAPSITIVA